MGFATPWRGKCWGHDSRRSCHVLDVLRNLETRSGPRLFILPAFLVNSLAKQSAILQYMMGSDNEPRRRSRLVELFSSEQFYPILDLLSLYLGLADFLVLCQVTKELYPLKDYLRRTYLSINIRLSDFVTAPHMFRSQLGKHDALISGGFALSFFEFNRWKVPNLDVFIEAGICAEEFTNYIREHEGYETSQENNPEVETVRSLFF